jgi:hypothetical protein
MFNYQFRYANLSGVVVRTTIMQCAADSEAIRNARHSMKDQYAKLEIFENERPVYYQESEANFTQP